MLHRNFIFIKFDKVDLFQKVRKKVKLQKEVELLKRSKITKETQITKINKKSFKFLIIGWELNSPTVLYLFTYQKSETLLILPYFKELKTAL